MTESGTERLSHEPCTCEPMVQSAVYCPYCGEEIHGGDHSVDGEIPEVFCPNTPMSTPRYCMGCGTNVDEYDWGSADQERSVYHDATTGDWVEVEGGDESYRRMEAAQRLGCAESDLRPGYDHSDRPSLDGYDWSKINPPADGILYLYRSSVDGFWYLETDEDMALQEATGYPVGELVEYERLGDYEDAERGDLHAIFVSPGKWRDNRTLQPKKESDDDLRADGGTDTGDTEREGTYNVLNWKPSAAARYDGDRECQYEDCSAEAEFFVEFSASGYTGGKGVLCCKSCGRGNRLYPEVNDLTNVPLGDKIVATLPDDVVRNLRDVEAESDSGKPVTDGGKTALPDEDEERWRELHEQPLDELSDAEVTSKIKLSVRRRFDSPEWVLMFEYGAPGSDGSVCDCLAVNTLPSRNYKVVGFEFKASRSDWLREKRDGQKADYFVQLVDEFYVVAPKGVVEESEIPDGWGYLELKPNSEQLYKLQDSELTEHQEGEPGRRFWIRFLEQTVGGESNYTREDLKEARSRGYQDAQDEAMAERRTDYNIDRLRRKADNWDVLQDSAFSFLPTYTFTDEQVRTLELAWKLADMVERDNYSSLRGDVNSLRDQIERKAESMVDEVDQLAEGMDVLQDRIEDGQAPTEILPDSSARDGCEGGDRDD